MMLHILIVKDLTKRTVADKILRNRAFNIAEDPKYDGYQRGLASVVYEFVPLPAEVVQSKLILNLHLKISN